MDNIGITTISSKGQIVIPFGMRKNMQEGDKMIIIQSGDKMIIKKAKDFEKNVEEDLEFAKRTEEALKRYEQGDFKKMEFDSFIEEMGKW